MDEILHIRIKKAYAANLIEDLVRANALEVVEEIPVELTDAQKAALDDELEQIAANPDYLLNWDSVRQHLFEKKK